MNASDLARRVETSDRRFAKFCHSSAAVLDKTRLKQSSILCILQGFVTKSTPPASVHFDSTVFIACAVTKTTFAIGWHPSSTFRPFMTVQASMPSMIGICVYTIKEDGMSDILQLQKD
jgi:hypothetical protein